MDSMFDSEFKRETMYYKFPEMGAELFSSQLQRFMDILYRPDSNRKQFLCSNESVELLDNKAKLYDENDKFMYIADGGKLISNDTLHSITSPSETVVVNIFHHNDLDGDTSAAIVSNLVDRPEFNNRVYYTAYSYGINFIKVSCEKVRTNSVFGKRSVAFVVDIALNEEDLRNILSSFDEVIWIDHHASSIALLKNGDFNLCNAQVVVDTRYSAAYLAYHLLKDHIKEYCGLTIRETMPTLVSIFDVRPDDKSIDTYLPVVLTAALRRKIVEKNMPFREEYNSIDIYPSDPHGKQVLEELKKAYIKNAISRKEFSYNKSLRFATLLNAYYRSMGGMTPYSKIYQSLFTDDKALEEVINVGEDFKNLEITKNSLISNNETIYSAHYDGKYIMATSNNNWVNISQDTERKNAIKMVVRKSTSSRVTINVKSANKTVKDIGLDNIFKDSFSDYVKGGHKGVSSIIIPISDINNIFDDLNSSRQYSPKFKNFSEMKEVFNELSIEVSGSKLREDEDVKDAFLVMCTVIFTAIASYNQENAENLING